MEEIQLSETEQRYFGDLFVCCDSDNTGKIPVYKASELFRSANLPLDVLKQVIHTQHERTSQSVMKFYKKQILIICLSLYIWVHGHIFQLTQQYPLYFCITTGFGTAVQSTGEHVFRTLVMHCHSMKTCPRQEIFQCSGVRHAIFSIAVAWSMCFFNDLYEVFCCVSLMFSG